MSAKKAGGHAFPNVIQGYSHEEGPGMTLRDYFAAKALQGYLSAHAGDGTVIPSNEVCARRAYQLADAMLAERVL